MIVSWLEYFIGDLIPDVFGLLNQLMIVDGVSWLGLGIAVTLLCVLIGSLLMRV